MKLLGNRRDTPDRRRAGRLYTRLRVRIDDWLARHRVRDTVRDYLLLLPDFVVLLERLLRDPRITLALKGQLLAVTLYVLSPIDLVPDIFLPSGLVDDTVAVAFILSRIVRIMGEAGEDVLREHWDGKGEVLTQIQQVAAMADRVVGARVLEPLRKMFH